MIGEAIARRVEISHFFRDVQKASALRNRLLSGVRVSRGSLRKERQGGKGERKKKSGARLDWRLKVDYKQMNAPIALGNLPYKSAFHLS